VTNTVGRGPSHDTDAGAEAPTRRQVVKFSFFKLGATWRLLPPEKRDAGLRAFRDAVDAFADRLQVRAYSVIGMRGDADFLLWQIGENLDDIQALHSALLATPMGPYIAMPYSYLAMTRPSQYVSPEEGSARLHLHPADSRYFFVYPFVKTREWYQLSQEERQEMMNEHIRVGRKYPSVKLNTTYSFGLDDQEFVVSFETDEPADFLDLVMELREAKTSLYTLRDTPIFTCISMPLRETLESVAGVSADASPFPHVGLKADPQEEMEGWATVARTADVPEGTGKLVYHNGEQVALFNAGGRFYAISNRCPHANGPLADGTLTTEDGRRAVTCPLHASRFDLETGEPLRGPANRPVKTYPVSVDGDAVSLPTA
jgi:NAD(P)H-dependent nitrite reductase small subunit